MWLKCDSEVCLCFKRCFAIGKVVLDWAAGGGRVAADAL